MGFVNKRLYLFPYFLRNKPVDRLLGKDLSADDFNDDVLGRCLGKIYDYGTTKLFSEGALEIGMEQGLLGNSVHIDTSTLSLFGDYTGNEIHSEQLGLTGDQVPALEVRPIPRHGYSKDHRPDLKQMVINLAQQEVLLSTMDGSS